MSTDGLTDTQRALSEGLRKLFPGPIQVLHVQMLFGKEGRAFLKKTEDSYRRAAHSKLRIGGYLSVPTSYACQVDF